MSIGDAYETHDGLGMAELVAKGEVTPGETFEYDDHNGLLFQTDLKSGDTYCEQAVS